MKLSSGFVVVMSAALFLLSASTDVQSQVRLNEVFANNVSVLDGGVVTDWVELINPTAGALDISDTALSDSASLRRFTFPPGSVVPAGGRLVVHCSLPAAGSVTNTGFGLKANGGAVYFFARLADGGAILDSITYGVQAANYSIGRVPEGSGNWVLMQPTPRAANVAALLDAPSALKVNEWMANPRSGSDYFEIYNPGNRPVALGGLGLTDTVSSPQKYLIPALSFIGVGSEGAFALFIAENGTDANYTGFSLSSGGEAVGIFNGATRIDSVTFGAQTSGVSSGRFPDGGDSIVNFDFSPSPGRSNQSMGEIADILINELLTHTDPPLEDAIEFRNITSRPINLKGWRLDSVENDLNEGVQRYLIATDFIVPANGYKVMYENQFSATSGLRFNSAHGGELTLYQADENGYFTAFKKRSYGSAENGVSFGLVPTSTGQEWETLAARTFGADNPSSVTAFRRGNGLTNSGARSGPLVISEIHYHPPDIGTNDNTIDEFIELRNLTSRAVKLFDPTVYRAEQPYNVNGEIIQQGTVYADGRTNTWRLRGEVDFNFPLGQELAAQGHLLIVSFDPATNAQQLAGFKARFPGIPETAIIVGPYLGKLNNASGTVELKRPDAPQGPTHPKDFRYVPYFMVNRVQYKDSAPWPPEADGTGLSLQKRFADRYGNDAVNWKAASPTPGQRNAEPPALIGAPQNVAYVFGSDAIFAIQVTGTAPILYQWSFKGTNLPEATNATLVLQNLQPGQVGDYSVTAANDEGSVKATATLRLDSVKPILTVTSPKPNIRWSNDTIVVQGTVRDDFGVSQVLVRLNGGEFLPADGATNWSIELPLAAGTNVIQVTALDLGQNSSPTNTLRLVRVVLGPLSLLVNGAGAVSPDLGGQMLELGRFYTLTATPAVGQLLSNWTGGLVSSANPLTFAMRSNLNLQANFVPNPFIASRGLHNGLFYDEGSPAHANAGFVTVTLADSGTFSAQLLQGSKKYSFTGGFGLDGRSTNRVSFGGTNSVNVELQLDFADPGRPIRGRVIAPAWTASLLALPAGFTAASPTTFAGSHTMTISGSDTPDEPAGDGYGTLKISSVGLLTFSGVLADSTKVSHKVALTRAGHWPFYANLYGGKGAVFGWLQFQEGAPFDTMEGTVLWTKLPQSKAKLFPGGFALTASAQGSAYTPPAAGQRIIAATNTIIEFSGGNLAAPIQCGVELAADNKIVNRSTNKLTLTFTTASGLFGGSVTDPASGRKVSFKGSLLEQPASGGGFFTGTNESGRVRLGN